jgi:site-specific recombinase
VSDTIRRRGAYDVAVEGIATDRGRAEPPGIQALWSSLAALPREHDPSGWAARVRWIEAFCAWLAAEPGTARLESFAASCCRAAPERIAALREAFHSVFESGHGLRLLADGGFPQRPSLVEESLVRIVRGVVPPVPESHDLGDVVHACLAGDGTATWLEGVSSSAIADFLESAGLVDPRLWPGLRTHLAEAVRIHGLRCAAIGFGEDVRRALGRSGVEQSPFHRLDTLCSELMAAASGSSPDVARCARIRTELERCVADVREARGAILDHLERTGVSTGMVARLDHLARGLDRIQSALPILAPRRSERAAESAASLLRVLVLHLRHDANIANAFRDRSRLLARKIVDYAAATGSEYITFDRAAWWRMFWMGCGGGTVISVASWIKAFVIELHPPPGTLSLLVFLDYAMAFLVIYAAHWTLATKQPPATAAALADALATGKGHRDPRPLQVLMARISRSQLAGLVGNVLFTVAGCVAIEGIHRAVVGRSVLESGEAEKVLREHAPLGSGTLLYAIVTGVAVWLSSMAAGWAENASAYGRLKESLVPLDPMAGRTRGGRVTAWIVNHLGGVVGNVSLALFLVSISFLGKVFGVPLDVRHVTLSTGMVTFGACSVLDLASPAVVGAVIGVGCVGFLNIATGFALSLSVAVRARGVSLRSRIRLLPAMLSAPLRRPLAFLYPFGRETEPPV